MLSRQLKEDLESIVEKWAQDVEVKHTGENTGKSVEQLKKEIINKGKMCIITKFTNNDRQERYKDFYTCPICGILDICTNFNFCPQCGAEIFWDIDPELLDI